MQPALGPELHVAECANLDVDRKMHDLPNLIKFGIILCVCCYDVYVLFCSSFLRLLRVNMTYSDFIESIHAPISYLISLVGGINYLN